MKNISLLFWTVLLVGCTDLSLSPRHDWTELQPYVLSVTPEDSAALIIQKSLQLQFSQALLAESLDATAVFLMPDADYVNYSDDWRDMVDDIQDEEAAIVDAALTLADDQKTVLVTLNEELQAQTDYRLVVTPKLLSGDHVPLNQALAGGEAVFFTTNFLAFAATGAGQESTQDAGQTAVEAVTAEVASDIAVTSAATANTEAAAADATVENANSTEATTAVENPIADFVIASVVLSEIVTDPQQDFNDSLGGNQVVFDSILGSGTVGSTDEYIELYNGSTDAVDLSGWSLSMQDGTDENQFLSIETWAEAYFTEEGSFADFESGEFAVLGNPDGQMNNEITVTLFDESGQAVDSIFVEDANANGLTDEAYSLDLDTGIWSQTTVSPGF